MPDRLPSLIVLVGFWIPPAMAGWAAAWFLLNLIAMPPYIPGATKDPTYAPPRAVTGLAVFASTLILPGSALACALAFRRRRRMLRRPPTSHASA